MRKNVGRNSPCHCGSGKKYKKCCLSQDENIVRIEQNPDLLYEEIEEEFVENHQVDSDPSQFSNEFSPPDIDQTTKPEAGSLPEITAKEQKLVNDWGEKYVMMKDPDQLLHHLKQFLQGYPTLVPHLWLEEEALFEIGAMLLRHERGNEYVEVLLEIRQNFPDVYIRSYSYYDRDLMVYHICQGEVEKAIQLMDNFTKYPDDDPDVLFSLIDFLCASNQQSLLSELLKEIYLKVLYSKNVIGAGEIIEPFLWACYYIPELENSYDEKSINVLSKTFKTLKIDFRDEYYQSEFLIEKLNKITKKTEEPFKKIYESTKNVHDFYYQISMNFIGWLQKNRNIPWLTAYYYHTLISKYYQISIPANKRPKIPFVFIQRHFDKILTEMSQQLFSLNATKVLSSFRAFHWFADYLLAHQAISEKEAKELQGWCKVLNTKILPNLLHSQFEAQYFHNDNLL